MHARDYIQHDAVGLAELIRSGQVAVEEVLQAALDQVSALNPTFNAIVESTRDLARSQIATLDRSAPFAGVPYLIKDLHTHVAGSHLRQGSRFLRDNLSTVDSDLVRRLKQAGFLIIGRSNSPEFGLNTTTEPVLFGATCNPWDITVTAGGSSGGSAAAVSSGMVPAAHATDSGGSIRIPAACCGLVGMKPSRGRVLAGLDAGEGWHDLYTAHAVTRSVRDSAAILLVTWNADAPAPCHSPRPLPASWQQLTRPVPGLTVGVLARPPSGVPVATDCLQALDQARQLCEEEGHRTVPVTLEFDTQAYGSAFTLIMAAKVAAAVASHEAAHGVEATADDFESAVWHCIELGRRSSAVELNQATARLHLIAGDIARQLAGVDVVLSPTLASAPIPLGQLLPDGGDIAAFLARVFEFAPFTSVFNATGQPAVSLPLFWNAQQLPIGVQFAAACGREDILFGLAAALERRLPWRDRQLQLLQTLCP